MTAMIIVDDDPFDLALMASSFRDLCPDADIFTADSVDQALEDLQEHPDTSFEYLVTDYNLPGRSGFDLIECLADDRRFASARFFVVSAMAAARLRRELAPRQLAASYEKPVDFIGYDRLAKEILAGQV